MNVRLFLAVIDSGGDVTIYYTYDAMGNILSQKRNGGGTSATALDELTYNYHTTTDGLVSNRLYHVNDVVSAGNYSDDIDDQGTFNNTHSTIETANNYGYDELGNLVRDVQEEIASIEWTVYGKMKKITRNSGSSKADLEFGYDASGNRLWKKVTPKGSGAVISTYYYLRDAQGNEMCRYVKYTNTNSQLMYVAQEHSIYGSSRVGVDNRKDTLYMSAVYTTNWGGANTSRRALGLKSFELSNHLGNVLVTVSDKPIYKVSSGSIYFNPEITSISDYYPFGAPIAGRSAAFGGEYRFGFNGKEDDGQVNGEGNSIDFGARMYDSRLGRFLSVDPLAADYPSLSPYVFVANNPINAIDPDGRKILFINGHYQDNWVGRNIVGSDKAGAAYWGDDMASSAQKFFKDYSNITSSNYINGSSKFAGDMSGQDRYKAGMAYAKANLEVLTADMGDGETFKMVTHSEGSAYGAGVAQYLLDQGYKVETVVHLSADEGDEFSTPTAPVTYQLGNDGDWVTGNKNIKGVDKSGIVNSGLSLRLVHGMTRNGSVFQNVIDLTTVRTQDNIGMVNGQAAAWKTQIPGTTTNGTDFTRINGAEIMDQDGTPKIK